jgi:hypothetical protein
LTGRKFARRIPRIVARTVGSVPGAGKPIPLSLPVPGGEQARAFLRGPRRGIVPRRRAWRERASARSERTRQWRTSSPGSRISRVNANPYAGKKMPGGTAQIVTNRKSATAVYTERLTYGFPKSGVTGLAASVPDGASNLLLTTFPKLTDAQRTSILAQTEISSGYPLDQTGSTDGSWERLNLAKAMSATVTLSANGTIRVVSTGGTARVIAAPHHG